MTRFLHRFARAEDGSATIEFVLFFPLFFTLFLSTFELGMLQVRQVMLDRGVDLAVRQIRLGAFADVDPAEFHDTVRGLVCDFALLIPDCDNQLRLEMEQVDPRAWSGIDAVADCVDRSDPGQPVRQFTPGQSNDLMVLRACALFDPYFPSSGLGAGLQRVQGSDAYGLLSTSSFSIEPI
jgi:hypothetical protein